MGVIEIVDEERHNVVLGVPLIGGSKEGLQVVAILLNCEGRHELSPLLCLSTQNIDQKMQIFFYTNK